MQDHRQGRRLRRRHVRDALRAPLTVILYASIGAYREDSPRVDDDERSALRFACHLRREQSPRDGTAACDRNDPV